MPLILIGGLAAALIAAQLSQNADAQRQVPPEPVLQNAIPVIWDEGELHEQVHHEPRDRAWADASEKALRDAYSAIPHMNDLAPVRVLCGTSLCEVANTLPESQIDHPAFDTLLHDIQQGPQEIALQIHNGLQPMTSRFGGRGPNGGTLFVEYWSRGAWKPEADPMFGEILKPEDHGSRALYQRIRTEVREPSWADPTEAGLLAALKAVPALQKGGHDFTAHCAISLCEVSARTSVEGQPDPHAYAAFMNDLQGTNWRQATEGFGLRDMGTGFIWLRPAADQYLFYAYFARTRS